MRVSIPILFAVSILIAGAPTFAGEAQVCTGPILNHRIFDCETLELAKSRISCGLTDLTHPSCASDMDDCFLTIGQHGSSTKILIEWLKDGDTNEAPPSSGKCEQLRAHVEACPYDLGELIRECPDETISGIEECNFFCEEGREPVDSGIRTLWGERCRAYALMPKGWDHWTPASGFFTVGRHFPGRLLNDDGESPYTASRALAEDQLGPILLGAVGTSPLWGALESGAVPINKKAFKQGGLCVDHRGALLASPMWSAFDGIVQFPVVERCNGSGLDLYNEAQGDRPVVLTESLWRTSGALLGDVLPALRRGARAAGFEVVCVTPELASQRRSLRAEAQP